MGTLDLDRHRATARPGGPGSKDPMRRAAGRPAGAGPFPGPTALAVALIALHRWNRGTTNSGSLRPDPRPWAGTAMTAPAEAPGKATATAPDRAGAPGEPPAAAVVVGVDGSANSRAALRFAASEAARRHATLTVLAAQRVQLEHLTTSGPADRPEGMSLLAMLAAAPFAEATVAAAPPVRGEVPDRRLRSLVDAELGASPALRVDLQTWQGRPARVLAERAADAALLVVGARGAGGFRGLLLGSTAEQVVHRARCPVAVVRRDWAEPERAGAPVVAGIDTPSTPSAGAVAVLRFAAEEARLRQVPLHLLVVRSGDAGHGGPDGGGSTLPDAVVAGVRDLVATVTGHRDLAVSLAVAHGQAGTALVDGTRDAALLVIGASHRGPAGHEAGSVHGQVVRHARCPVVVVRPREGDDAAP